MIDVVAFDADDTLWHNEVLYASTQERLERLLAPYHADGRVQEELYKTEMQNLPYFGYGIKGFALSMIETAIRISEGQVEAAVVQEIIGLAKEMVEAPAQLLDHVADVVAGLAASYTLMLITKGDLFDQERKVARSGLAPYFGYVEVVSSKTPEIYRSLLVKHGIAPERFLMVGNSLRSDILPIVALGARAVYIPYHLTWAHEVAAVDGDVPPAYVELEHIGLLPAWIEQLDGQERPHS
jgi:putative hydrolase of the HAD superfamily